MKRAWLVLSLVLLAAPAGAYDFTDCDGVDCHWNHYPVTYVVRGGGCTKTAHMAQRAGGSGEI